MVAVSMPGSAPPKAGDEVNLTVGEAVHGGWCIARAAAGGPVVFVRHALPGEQVIAVITQVTSRLARADAVQVTGPAPGRVTPPCPHARPGGCGGCDWQHASPAAQRELKAAVVGQQLRRIAGIDRVVTVEPLPGDPAGLGWRTRVRYAVGPGGQAGLRRHRSHEIAEIGDCPIAHPLVNEAGVTRRPWPGLQAVAVAAAAATGQRALTQVPRNRRRAAKSLGDRYLTEQAAGRSWRVGPATFWQVHPAAADVLSAAVLAELRPAPGDRALDLYCGAGLFAGVLAAAVGPAGRVTGIEEHPGAAADARFNLRDTPWAAVRRGDVAAVLARDGLAGASLAVLDPPRPGAAAPVTRQLCAPGPLARIGYVSCDPATLARDLKILCAAGWRLTGLRAFDAFPMTHHVECLATLERDPAPPPG
jgi:tRNA/tmRNA/rRNA uracil-C5-methylase (TrmA/RlmC/RlmD family)